MAWRVSQEDVRGIIETDASISLAPFLDTATALTDYVSSQDSDSKLTTALLVQVEKYLAAHYYAHREQLYAESQTLDAKAKYQGDWGRGLSSTQYGQAAIDLDVSGTLRRIDKGVVGVGIDWLGYPPSDQTDYVDRD